MLIQVLTSAKSPGIAEGLTYTSKDKLKPGSIVTVPLRNKPTEGIVLGKGEKSDFELKEISARLHEKPLLTNAHIATMHWMAEHYCISLRQAMRVFLPSPPWNALLPKEDADFSVSGSGKPTLHRPTLTPQQKSAHKIIKKSKVPSLLFGVTGSGKTEVYAELICDTVQAGKQAIVLVPEILLTEAIITRFEELMDRDSIAVLHSRLTPAARRKEWQRIRFGDIKLVIGSRSALFAPVTNLGLLIIDEEHEWTYKNEQTPRYHARETAEVLCKEFGAKLVLGTATPSIESWSRTKSGRYTLARLDDRYGEAKMPLVKVVDLANVHFGNDYPFSRTLYEAIEERLARGEQSVLFLNRRGVATSLLCLDCRRRVVSPESNLPFTVHKRGEGFFLQDHTTGSTAEVPAECPGCQSTRLQAVGAGTQRIEDILSRRFPEARLLRADSDTLTHPKKMRVLLETMQDNKADILLGTQSVVKGLDLPNVTLAAVLVADVGMSLPHFRAGERTFQLLTQLTGRSGRSKPGEVIIQTFRPDAPEVKMAALHQTEDYIKKELSLREHAGYPPATEMVRLIVRGEDSKLRAEGLTMALLDVSENLAIGCAPTLFGGGKEWHILIRGKDPRKILEKIDLRDVVLDVDPMDCV